MSIPRELRVRDGILYQRPIRELEALRRDEVLHERVELSNGAISLPGVSGRTVDLEVEVEPAGEGYNRFALRFAKNEEFYTGVSFRPHESVVKIDRKFSGSRRAIIHQRRAMVPSEDGAIRIRLILDRYSAEAFINEGEQTITANLYTDMGAQRITFNALGAVSMNIVKYDLI
jgi:beta-fructofuranosidase